MWIKFMTRYSPAKGQRFDPGAVVEVDDEIALDLINRQIALPVRTEIERAVGPGQMVT